MKILRELKVDSWKLKAETYAKCLGLGISSFLLSTFNFQLVTLLDYLLFKIILATTYPLVITLYIPPPALVQCPA